MKGKRDKIFNNRMVRRVFLCLLLGIGAVGLLSGCQGAGRSGRTLSASREFFAMDTYMQILCYGDNCEAAADAAVEEINRLDALLSVGRADSEVSRINESGSGVLSEDTRTLAEAGIRLYERTGGAFDITVFPLMELWGFTTGNYRVPTGEEFAGALKLCDSGKLFLEEDSGKLTLAEGQGIDFGGIAKGYASDRLAGIFEEYDLESAYVSLGGNIHCYHKKTDGSYWRIGIKDPLHPEQGEAMLGVVSVADRAVITSGGYERYFTDEATGQRYHHIIDPSTGYPADSDLVSVTVVSAWGMLADGLSTSCYVLGLEGSIELWREYGSEPGGEFGLILMTADGVVYVTEDLKGAVETNYPAEIIGTER